MQKAAIRAQPRTDILLKRDRAVTDQSGEPLGFHRFRENRRTEAKSRLIRKIEAAFAYTNMIGIGSEANSETRRARSARRIVGRREKCAALPQDVP
jgi:hypothetical protein